MAEKVVVYYSRCREAIDGTFVRYWLYSDGSAVKWSQNPDTGEVTVETYDPSQEEQD